MAEAIAKSKSKKKQEEDVGKRGNFGWPSGAFLYHLFSRLSERERGERVLNALRRRQQDRAAATRVLVNQQQRNGGWVYYIWYSSISKRPAQYWSPLGLAPDC
jgi:hypothetical protein